MIRLSAFVLTLAGGALALAQGTIQWQFDAKKAVAMAKSSNRPIIVYVEASNSGSGRRNNDDGRDDDTIRADTALRDPRVLRAVSSFVCLRLLSGRDREILPQFGLGAAASREMAFVSPDGDTLAPPLSSGGVGQVDSLLSRFSQVRENWGRKIFEKELKPIFDSKDSKPEDLQKALRVVVEMRIKTADTSVIALFARDPLDAATKTAALDTLTALSTKLSVEKLLELARKDDAAAKKALEKCSPAGAEFMLDELKDKDGKFDFNVYAAVTKICRIGETKPRTYFEKSRPESIDKELDRVRQIVRQQAQAWRDQND